MGIGSIAKVVAGKAALPITAAFGVKDAYDGVKSDDQGALSQASSGAHQALNGLTFGGWGKLGSEMGTAAPDGSSWGQYETKIEKEATEREREHAKEMKQHKAELKAEGSHDMGTAAGVVNTAYDKVTGGLSAVGKPVLGAIAAGAGAIDKMIDSEHGHSNPVLSAIDGAAGAIESLDDGKSHGHDGPASH